MLINLQSVTSCLRVGEGLSQCLRHTTQEALTHTRQDVLSYSLKLPVAQLKRCYYGVYNMPHRTYIDIYMYIQTHGARHALSIMTRPVASHAFGVSYITSDRSTSYACSLRSELCPIFHNICWSEMNRWYYLKEKYSCGRHIVICKLY